MSLADARLAAYADRLRPVAARLSEQFPGERPERQPVHTVYGGAHLFRSDTPTRLGELALRSLEAYAADSRTFADAIGLAGGGPEFHESVYERVREKLRREPVEDFRLDFEDGYGNRPDEEEDGHARSAAEEVAKGLSAGTLSPFIGIRVKPFSGELHRRAIRTLDLFISTLWESAGALPERFLVTLPKVQDREQVAVLADLLDEIEAGLGLPAGQIASEIMVETPQSIIGPDGLSGVRRLIDAGRGRVAAAHFGTYDYTAACNITAAYQTMTHPACDFARNVQQVSLAGTGVWLSDGATNVMPVSVHRGESLTEGQQDDNRRTVHAAWRLHFLHVRHSLGHGYYQGWDLHPAQLPTRYAAVFSFFMEGLTSAGERLRNFVGQAAQATLVGEVFDDAATGQGLLNHFLRAVNCGAISEEEATKKSGLTLEELRSRSFLRILDGRRGA